MTFSCTALLAAAFGLTVSFTAVTSAAPLVQESFNYDTGSLAGNNGGTGFTGAWVNTKRTPTVAVPGLTWGDLDVAGGYARGGSWSGSARPIAGTLDANLADGTTLWFSVILGLEGQNTSNADINIALTNAAKFDSGDFGNRENLDGAANEGIGITHTGGNIRGVYWDNAGGRTESAATTLQLSSNGVNNPTSALVAGKIDWTATGETLTLYAPDANLNLGSAIATLAVPNLNQTAFNNLALQFKDNSQIDEFRFGATSDDALGVPEPSSLALLGLGGLLIARRRRG